MADWEKERERRVIELDSFAQWIGAIAARSLLELNEQVLELLAEQSAAPVSQSNTLLRLFGELWRQLDHLARKRLAACPFLLVDLGFTDASRWQLNGSQVRDLEAAAYAPFFTVQRGQAVARQVFAYAWDLARTQEAAARVLLAMPPHCTRLISSLTIRQIHELAEAHPDWLMPRWHKRAKIWRNLLQAAATGEGIALVRARNHGYDLMEADCREAALLVRGGSAI